MPYIKENRSAITEIVNRMWMQFPVRDPGDLNFMITRILELYRNDKMKYSLFNEIIGVLESVKQEYYRRMVAPYEDTKREENGDVYNI